MHGFGTIAIASLLAILATAAVGDTQGQAAPGDRWRAHVLDDLLPFWDDGAIGNSPGGSFPGRLCNDGALPVAGVACDGVTARQASNPRQFLVGQSRQVYSYAVAFHLTGDPKYLDIARKGADYLFDEDAFFDRSTGLFNEGIPPGRESGSGN